MLNCSLKTSLMTVLFQFISGWLAKRLLKFSPNSLLTAKLNPCSSLFGDNLFLQTDDNNHKWQPLYSCYKGGLCELQETQYLFVVESAFLQQDGS